jgi:hypothetical protein
MEESRISRRQGLAILGAVAGSALLGTSLAGVANATPSVRRIGQGKPSAVAPAGTQYVLDVVNETEDFHDFCVYQVDPDIGDPDVMSLAWLTKGAEKGTGLQFTWTIDYTFIWSETGPLVPGATFSASEIWPADPSIVGVCDGKTPGNQVGLTFHQDHQTYEFTSTATKGAEKGSLYVAEDGTLPSDRASVGIGMGGSGTFAVQAKPNLHVAFTPHPVYYLMAGSFKKGEVLDIGVYSDSVNIEFDHGVFEKKAILQADNTWIVI